MRQVQIDAVELDTDAVKQAERNERFPWRERIRIIRHDIRTFQAPHIDLIISNPPYFEHGQTLPDAARQLARHTVELDQLRCWKVQNVCWRPVGKTGAGVAGGQGDEMVALAMKGWYLQRRCLVETKREKRQIWCYC